MQEEFKKKANKRGWSRKFARLVFFVAFVFLISALSVMIVDRSIFPRLAASKLLSKYSIFKAATENVVVVNKTEQVTVSEDETISHYSNKSSASVVEIISTQNDAKSPSRIPEKNQVKFGSGVIVTADGLVLTYRNAILEDRSSYKVLTAEGEVHEARLAAVDAYTNLAFLKIDGVENLPTASFIAPEDIKVGAKVVAIGKNGENFHTVYKAGLVSQFMPNFSIAGPVASSEKLTGVYRADFNMSGGNSDRMIGGAVADYNGNVVGILGSAKIGEDDQYFIISVDHVEDLVSRYLGEGSVKRAALGVYFLPLDAETASIRGLKVKKGGMIFAPSMQQGLAVISGSSAEKAGLRIMDVILSVDSDEISQEQSLSQVISKHKPGDEVSLKILREGNEMDIKAVLQ